MSVDWEATWPYLVNFSFYENFRSVRPGRRGWGWGVGPVPLESSCLNIKYYHSTLKYLSFKVLHDNTNQNHDFTHFRGTPILGGSKKGVRGVKKIGPQHFRVLYTLRVLQTKNQKMNPKIERRVVFLTLRHALYVQIIDTCVIFTKENNTRYLMDFF